MVVITDINADGIWGCLLGERVATVPEGVELLVAEVSQRFDSIRNVFDTKLSTGQLFH